MSGSIQRRLRGKLVIGLLLLTVAAGGAIYLYVRSALLRQFDAALSARADGLSVLVEHTRGGSIEFEFSPLSMPEFSASSLSDFFVVLDDRGKLFAASPSLKGMPLDARSDVPLRRPWNCTLPNGRPGRAMRMRFRPRLEVPEGGRTSPGPDAAEAPMTLILARDRAEIDKPLEVLLTSLLVTAGALSIGTILLVTQTLRRGLRPLRTLAEQAGGIDADRLEYRFPTQDVPDELLPICRKLNDLLGRLQDAFGRERRFTSDVAHELRTPIAELKSLAEVSLLWPCQSGLDGQSARDALAIANQMERIVSSLLALARCHAGMQRLESKRVNLSELVENLWEPFAADALQRKLRVQFDLPEPIELQTDPTFFASVIANLLSNASAYTPDGGAIEISARASGSELRFAVQNTCNGLSPGDLAHVFEPFWRKDAARAGGQHSGLGLSLVQTYASLLGMKAIADLPETDQFRIVLTSPEAAIRLGAHGDARIGIQGIRM
jgi:signal transduction histidine kinase